MVSSCVVHALKGMACCTRVTPASSHASPYSGKALTSPLAHVIRGKTSGVSIKTVQYTDSPPRIGYSMKCIAYSKWYLHATSDHAAAMQQT